MSAETSTTCPHDRATFTREPALYSYVCPECKARVCLECRRYSKSDFMNPLVSWMTGTCDGCYRNSEQRRKIREQHHAESRGRKALATAWEAGRAASLNDSNPHAEPDWFEAKILSDNPWLATEIAELEAECAEITGQQNGGAS